jgi:hypothetical protein
MLMEHKYSTYVIIGILLFGTVGFAAAGGFESIKFFGDNNEGYIVENYENKPVFLSKEYLLEVSAGNVEGSEIIHKFGANDDLSNSWEPVSEEGVYRTPKEAESLEMLSTSSQDGVGGTGARIVKVLGLNSSWDEIEEDVILNGVTPVVLTNNFTRVYRMYVVETGTYANESVGSHVGKISLRGVGGGMVWASLNLFNGFPESQTEIGAFTIPRGRTGFLLSTAVDVDSSKPVDVMFFVREKINDTTSPYGGAMRAIQHHKALTSPFITTPNTPIDRFPEMTDIGFMGYVQTTGSADVDFELLLVDNQ